MKQIVGTLLDSGGNPLTGKLVVSLTGAMIEDSTTPDTIYLTEPYTFDITSGVVDIELEESETKNITYNFKFYKVDINEDLIEPPLLDFNALVPDVAEVPAPGVYPIQFASLVPTGIVNSTLDTGALRVARIIASNPNLAANIGGPFPKGDWSPSVTYSYRDLVNYLNRTYISRSLNPITGILPTDDNNWMVLPVEPDGNLILGDDTPYGVEWDGSGKAASQDAVYDVIQTVNSNIALKANINNPIFTGIVTVPNQTANSNNNRAANTAYVDEGLALKADLTYVNTELALKSNITYVDAGLALKANLASPALTGNPTAPTPANYDNDTSIATTAFCQQLCRPYFSALLAELNTPTSTDNIIINYPSEIHDTNNCFSSGTFTVPPGGTGIYLFGGGGNLINLDPTERPLGFDLRVNNINLRQLASGFVGSNTQIYMSWSTILLFLSTGDTVSTVTRNYNQASLYRWQFCYFWGYRVGV